MRGLELVVSVAIGAAMIGSGIALVAGTGLPDVLTTATARGYPAGWLAAGLCCGALGLWCAGWFFAGPLALDPADLRWHLVRRPPSRQLRRRSWTSAAAAVVLAAVLVYVVATAADGVGADPVAPAVGAAGSLLGVVPVVVELQRRDLGVVAGYLALVLVGTGVVIGAAVAWGSAAAVAVGAAIAVAMVVELGREPNLRRPRPGLTPQWQLRRAAMNRWATVASLQTLDPSVAGLSRTGRAGRTDGPPPGPVRRLPWAPGLAAVVALRNLRTGAVPALVSLLGGLVVHQVWATTAALVVVLTLETVVTIWLARPLEAWRTTPSLRRTWTPPRSGAALALALPSLLVSWAVAVAAALVIRPPWPALVIMAVLPAAVLWRRSRAGRSDLGDVLLATPLGPVPVGLVDRVAAGPDVLVLAFVALSVVS